MKKIFKISFIPTLFVFPLITFAALDGIKTLIEAIGDLIKTALPITVALALLLFFWGLAKFILKSGDPTAQTEGKNRMIWGIVALFVMVSVWGIVNFIQSNLGLEDIQSIQAPRP